jgi:hypothetical protein
VVPFELSATVLAPSLGRSEFRRPDAPDHQPALLAGFRFHEGRHSHTTWLAEDGVPEIARRARVGHKMPGIARVYEHVTPEMMQQISEVLEARWLTAALALDEDELAKLLGWVPQLRSAIEAARRSQQVGSGSAMISQFSPTTS